MIVGMMLVEVMVVIVLKVVTEIDCDRDDGSCGVADGKGNSYTRENGGGSSSGSACRSDWGDD